jgi:hypothetical protein
MAQFPDRDALHDQPKGDDQGGGLQWREDVKPHRRRDEPEGKAGEARYQRGRKGGEQKNHEVGGGGIHLAPDVAMDSAFRVRCD